jgi:TolA-binding protein
MLRKPSYSHFLLYIILVVSVFSTNVWGQLDTAGRSPQDMPNAGLLKFIQEHPLQEAMPHMLEVIKRIEDDEEAGEQLGGLLARCYYELARFHYNQFVNEKKAGADGNCISYGKKLRKRFPEDSYAPMTLQFQINCHQVNKRWDDVRDSLTTGLNRVKSGLYSNTYKPQWLEDICYGYATEKLWEEGLPRFVEAYEGRYSSFRLKTHAAIYLIQAYEETEEPEKVLPLVPHLQAAKEIRYDPNLNLALYHLGNQFSEKGEFSSANYMYFLCLTIETIIVHNEDRLERMASRNQWYLDKNTPIPPELEAELNAQREYVEALKDQPSYTGPLKYHRACNLEEMGRKYDAYFAYLRLINEHPEHESAELFHYTAFNQADEIGYMQDTFDLGESYLKKTDYQLYRRETLVKLVAAYFEAERYDRVHALGRIFVRDYPEHLYGNNVVHFMGFSWMRLGQIAEARETLGGYLEKHPNAPLAQSAHYWVGLGDVIEQEFEAGAVHFENIIENHKGGNFYAEARFRRAVCDFGLGDYDAAETRFRTWVDDYPESHLRGEAEVFLGDIDAYYAKVETALAHYALTETFTPKMNLIDHAYFESVRLLDANSRYQDMIDLLEQYMDRYQETGNLSRAILRLGQAYESKGQPEVMVQAYFDAIVKYGNNPKAEGVDQIFQEFTKKYNTFTTHYQSTIDFIQKIFNDDEFRLRMADDRKALHMHRMEHQEIDADVIDSILRNQTLREGLGTRPIPQTEEEILAAAPQQFDNTILPEAREQLETSLARFVALLARFPKETPEDQLAKLFATAQAQSQRTLELRLLAAFSDLGIAPPGGTKISIQDLPYASPATLAWLGSELRESDPTLAELAIARVLKDHPDSLAMPDALNTKATMAYAAGNIQESIALLDIISDRYPTWPKTQQITLHAAALCLEAKQNEQALERYLSVLQVRSWRGKAWAEACYQIGQCYEASGETLKAHGFYERTYLTYRQFPKWAGKAYYHDGLLLEEMNEVADAKKVYEAYLKLPDAEKLDEYKEVRKRHETL